MTYTRGERSPKVLGCPADWTIEDAIKAAEGFDHRPFMDLIRERQNKWRHFWDKRGSNPVEYNPETAH